MALEKKIDLSSPFTAVVDKLKAAIESINGTTVDITLTPTPMQEVEASIERTKEAMPQSAASKLDPYSKPEKTSEDEYADAMKKIDTIGVRLAHLMEKIEAGKDITGNAAKEVEWLQYRLEKVAQSARDAAKAMGDEDLAKSATEMERRARAGELGLSEGGSGGGVSPKMLTDMLSNPNGFLQAGMMRMIQQSMGGIMETAAGAALGYAAAAAAGAYGGWKLHDSLAKDASSDAQKAVSDAMLSNQVGGVDFRGLTFDENRFGPRKHSNDSVDWSVQEVRNVWRGMGVGQGNFTSGYAGGNPQERLVDTAMQIARQAYGMGASPDQIAGMVGASIRSGGIGNDEYQIRHYLAEIAGSTAEAAKQGVSTNEHLGLISSLNQRSAASTGFLGPAAQRLNLQAANALEATGDRAVQGQNAGDILGVLAGNGGDAARANEIGMMLDSDGKLLPEYQAMVNANPAWKKAQQDMGDAYAANMLLDNPGVRDAVNQRYIRRMAGMGVNPVLAARQVGVQSGSTSKDATAVYTAALGTGDFLTQRLAEKSTAWDESTAAGRELSGALGAQWSQENRENVRSTGYDFETARDLNQAASRLNAAADHLGRVLSQDHTSNPMLISTPLAPLYWGNRALHK